VWPTREASYTVLRSWCQTTLDPYGSWRVLTTTECCRQLTWGERFCSKCTERHSCTRVWRERENFQIYAFSLPIQSCDAFMAESVNDMHHFKVTAITQTQYFIKTHASHTTKSKGLWSIPSSLWFSLAGCQRWGAYCTVHSNLADLFLHICKMAVVAAICK